MEALKCPVDARDLAGWSALHWSFRQAAEAVHNERPKPVVFLAMSGRPPYRIWLDLVLSKVLKAKRLVCFSCLCFFFGTRGQVFTSQNLSWGGYLVPTDLGDVS